jgi:hypothetical protein
MCGGEGRGEFNNPPPFPLNQFRLAASTPTLAGLVIRLADFSLIFMAIRKIAKSYYQLRLVCLSAWDNPAPTGLILMIFYI